MTSARETLTRRVDPARQGRVLPMRTWNNQMQPKDPTP